MPKLNSNNARIQAALMWALTLFVPTVCISAELNYDEMTTLDSEALAEGSMKAAYQKLLPKLAKYVKEPAKVAETLDHQVPSYKVRSAGIEYIIYDGKDQEAAQPRATFAFFEIVNRQLARSNVRFYAINGGNELGGMFLTREAAAAAQKSLAPKDRPYLPTMAAPWYGMQH